MPGSVLRADCGATTRDQWYESHVRWLRKDDVFEEPPRGYSAMYSRGLSLVGLIEPDEMDRMKGGRDAGVGVEVMAGWS